MKIQSVKENIEVQVEKLNNRFFVWRGRDYWDSRTKSIQIRLEPDNSVFVQVDGDQLIRLDFKDFHKIIEKVVNDKRTL